MNAVFNIFDPRRFNNDDLRLRFTNFRVVGRDVLVDVETLDWSSGRAEVTHAAVFGCDIQELVS
jgi:hypothetical protein